MKQLHVLLFLFIGITFCACGINSSKKISIKEQESTYSDELIQHPPQETYTIEELASHVSDFRNYIISSYQTIQELSVDEATYEAGKELTKKIEEEYGERIAELADIDFSGMTKEELTEYMSEFTSLTTIIRKAKDALTLG